MIIRHESLRHHGLDSLRFLSCAYIVGFWHLTDYSDNLPIAKSFFTTGVTVVLLGTFVLASGFLVSSKPIELDAASLSRFFRARLLRIYPPYFVALCVFVAIGLTTLGPAIRGALLVAIFMPRSPPTLWFISMLLVYYCITPWFAVLAKRPVLFICVVLLAFVGLSAVWTYTHYIDYRLAVFLPCYAAGVLVAVHREILKRITALAIIVLVGIAAFAGRFAALENRNYDLSATPVALFGSVALLGLALRLEKQLPYSGILRQLSAATYFMYLFHRPFFALLLRAFPRGTQALWPSPFLVVVGMPTLIALSWLGQSLYDRLLANCQLGSTSPTPIRRLG